MSKPIPVHYFIFSEYVGTGHQVVEFRGKKSQGTLTFWAPHSFFCYCPVCGDLWAKGLSTHPDSRHYAIKANCANHQGGSLLQIAGNSELPNLPHTREFLLHELDLYLSSPDLYSKRDIISQLSAGG